MSGTDTSQDQAYRAAAAEFGAALSRLAYGYERDPDKRTDLLQDIHFALWRSFKIFDGRSSLRTWVYRVAHNTGASHISKHRHLSSKECLNIENSDDIVGAEDTVEAFERIDKLERLMALINRLNPTDQQLILLYLDDLNAVDIGDIMGISPVNVATRIHRIKAKLTELYRKGD